MTKKKSLHKKDKEYSKEDVKYASHILGNEMNECSEKIWNVLMSYPMSPSQYYGILMSILLSISNDVYMQASEDAHVCNDCKDEIEKQSKNNPKKTKEINSAMYS